MISGCSAVYDAEISKTLSFCVGGHRPPLQKKNAYATSQSSFEQNRFARADWRRASSVATISASGAHGLAPLRVAEEFGASGPPARSRFPG